MSDVARILEAYGQAQAEAARQKAAVWGGAIQQIGQIPQQMQQAKLLQAREQRLTQRAASEQIARQVDPAVAVPLAVRITSE